MPSQDQPTLDETVERTRRARGGTYTVYEQLDAYVVPADEAENIGKPDSEASAFADFPIRQTLVVVAKGVKGHTADAACWEIAESLLKDRALSDDPSVLRAAREADGRGLSEAKPYALEPTVQRRK